TPAWARVATTTLGRKTAPVRDRAPRKQVRAGATTRREPSGTASGSLREWAPVPRPRRWASRLAAILGAEAKGRLVGLPVFKSGEGAKAPWRVRFPSASAA